MVGIRLAIIDLPAPGGPIIIILWPPAAAISTALRTLNCPRTSEKSTSVGNANSSNSFCVSTFVGTHGSSGFNSSFGSPFRKWITSMRFFNPYTSKPSTTAASSALASGKIKPLNPSFRAHKAIGNAPRIGCNEPSKDNSPTII